MRTGLLLLLGGCDLVFSLEGPPSPVCQHADLELCLTFENLAGGKTDDGSPRHLGATATGVTAVERLPGEHAIALQSDSDVVLDSVNDYDFPGPISIDLWLQYDAIAPDERRILDNEFQYFIGFNANASAPYCSAQIALASGGLQDTEVTGAAISVGEWHHVACVLDGSKLHTYVDGAFNPDNSQPTPGPINVDGGKPLRLGRAGSGDLFVFTGLIDNVRIWNRALTTSEIQKLANNEED